MKVLHVVNVSFVLPYYMGEQFAHFQNKGVDFYVACTPDPFFFEYCEQQNLKAIPLTISRKIDVADDIKAIRALVQIIKAEGIEVVIGHTPKGALIGMMAAAIAGVRNRVYFRHGVMYETSKGIKRALLKNIERFTGSLATTVICVSPSVLAVSNAEKLSSPTKNTLLNRGTCNGIDALSRFNRTSIAADQVDALKAQYGIEDHHQIVGYVGRLVNDKGINELIAAWKQIILSRPHARLLLVGPFEERDSLSGSLKEYISNEASIIHTGLVFDTAPYYALMDVFILPSYREGFPTVVLEASAMELPVITTRVTGCVDSIIEDHTGRFTDLQPADIAEKIGGYLDQPTLASEHGLNGRAFVLSNFEQRKIWQEIEEKVFNNSL